jgi:hypothetical protein
MPGVSVTWNDTQDQKLREGNHWCIHLKLTVFFFCIDNVRCLWKKMVYYVNRIVEQ